MSKVIYVLALVLVFTVTYTNAEEQKADDQGIVVEVGNEGEVLPEGILAIVNGQEITLEDFNKEVAALPANYKQMVDTNKDKFLDELILRELLYQEALAKDLVKDSEVKEAMELFQRKILAQKLISNIVIDLKVSDEDSKKYYEENKDQFKTQEKVQAAHILIKVEEPGNEASEKEALDKTNSILKEIKGGADFTELAKVNSACPSSSNGGDLGFFQRGQMVPEFDSKAFSLEKGELSDPVKTQFGYHIIKILDKQVESQEEYDAVKDKIDRNLLTSMQRDAVTGYTEDLKAKAKIKISNDFFTQEQKEEK